METILEMYIKSEEEFYMDFMQNGKSIASYHDSDITTQKYSLLLAEMNKYQITKVNVKTKSDWTSEEFKSDLDNYFRNIPLGEHNPIEFLALMHKEGFLE